MKRGSVACILFAAVFCTSFAAPPAVGVVYQQFSFTGDIEFAMVDGSPALLAGFDIGTVVEGSFRIGLDDSDADITPHTDNDTDYEFAGSPYGATLHNTTPDSQITPVTVVVSNNTTISGVDQAEQLSLIFGFTVNDGDPFDAWTVRTDEATVDGLVMMVSFFAFGNTGLLNDESYSPAPQASVGPGGFDVAIFSIAEADANGDTVFAGAGILDTYSLAVMPPIAGDANNDGIVDAADYIAVESNFGALGNSDGLLLGDANDDGRVDGNDWVFVEQHFGETFSGSPSVPEPSVVGLLVLSAAGLRGYSARHG